VSALATVLAALLSIGLLCTRRTETALGLCAAQGLCAAATLGAHGSLMAPAALLLNAVAVPLAAWRVLAEAVDPAPSPYLWLLAALLVVSAAAAFGALGNDIAAGIAVVLLGPLIAMQSNPAIGSLSAQNGVVLVAAAIPDLPPGSVLVAAVPLLPAILLGHAWLRR